MLNLEYSEEVITALMSDYKASWKFDGLIFYLKINSLIVDKWRISKRRGKSFN